MLCERLLKRDAVLVDFNLEIPEKDSESEPTTTIDKAAGGEASYAPVRRKKMKRKEVMFTIFDD